MTYRDQEGFEGGVVRPYTRGETLEIRNETAIESAIPDQPIGLWVFTVIAVLFGLLTVKPGGSVLIC